MDKKRLYEMMQDLQQIFDVVRLVDVEEMTICHLSEDGTMTYEPYKCYEVWKKHERCVNCISAKACSSKTRQEKFEFVNGEVFHVTSAYETVEGKDYILELVTKTNDETLFEAYGKGKFIQAISSINDKLYVDELTGLKNRRYYSEQQRLLEKSEAVALVDVDDFKQLNDKYGHSFGDKVLQEVSRVIMDSVRTTDTCVRYGGDEIFILFYGMKAEGFASRLEQIRNNVKAIRFAEHPEAEISVSIGGYRCENGVGDAFAIVDRQMYQAKMKKNHVEIFDASEHK